jgi:hypothetical protein
MRRWDRSIASAIVIVGVVGVMGWPAPRPPASQLSEPTCVGHLHGVPAGAVLDPQHDTGSRPPGFDTAAVVRCEPAEALTVDRQVTRVRMTTFTGDVAAVQAAFDRRLVMSPPFVLTEAEAEAGQLIESVGTLLRRVQRSQPST